MLDGAVAPIDLRTADGRRAERGAALAELVVVVPLMLLLLLVVFDFGQGFLAYISVTNGARDGARAALDPDRACSTADLRIVAENSSNPYPVNVTVQPGTPGSGQCSVTVVHTYQPILPFVTSAFTLPVVGTIGPLWDGTMSETMVSQ
jgi:hypothetical protein